jgi:hypothetical protein
MTGDLTDDAVVVATADQTSTNLDGEEIVLDLESGTYFSLSGVGDRIWEHVQTPSTVGELCDDLCRAYDVEPARVRPDVVDFVAELEAAGLVEVRDGTRTGTGDGNGTA